MFFTFGDVNAFYIPLLFGVGAEYLLQPNLALTGKLKMGPTWGTGDASGSSFTLYALVGRGVQVLTFQGDRSCHAFLAVPAPLPEPTVRRATTGMAPDGTESWPTTRAQGARTVE